MKDVIQPNQISFMDMSKKFNNIKVMSIFYFS